MIDCAGSHGRVGRRRSRGGSGRAGAGRRSNGADAGAPSAAAMIKHCTRCRHSHRRARCAAQANRRRSLIDGSGAAARRASRSDQSTPRSIIRGFAPSHPGARLVPPCGQVAGIIARTDAEVGVFKAPANAAIQDATDLEADLDPDSLAQVECEGRQLHSRVSRPRHSRVGRAHAESRSGLDVPQRAATRAHVLAVDRYRT